MRLVCLFLLLLSSSLYAAEEPIAVYLTWQHDPTTTMTIQWIGTEKSIDTLQFQRDGSTKWKETSGSHKQLPQQMPYLMHVAELTNLDADSSYRFRFTKDGKEYRFRTMPEDLAEPITFVVGGDANNSGIEIFKETNRIVASQDPHFALIGGDLAYAAPFDKSKPENGELWVEWVQAYSSTMITPQGYLIPLIVTIGNHDVKGHYFGSYDDAAFYYSLFAMPGKPGFNSLRFGNYLSLYLLDSCHTNPVEGTQTNWLEKTLTKDSAVETKIAIYHVPAYPSVRKYHSQVSASIRQNWVPLFDQYGLHVAFENHDHAYKRTFPLKNGIIDPTGVVYIGDGAWGVKPRTPKKANKTNYLARSKSVRQFVLVELSDSMRQFWTISIPKQDVIDHYVQFIDENALALR